MRHIDQKRLISILLVLIFTLTSCTLGNKQPQNRFSTTTKESVTKKTPHQTSFDTYTQKLFVQMVTSDSLTLHYTLSDPTKYGIQETKHSLKLYDDTSIDEERLRIAKNFQKLATFDYNALTTQQLLTYDCIYDSLSRQEAYLLYPYLQTPLSPTTGQQAQLIVTLCEFPLNSKADVETYFSLLKQVPAFLSSLLSFEKEKIKRDYAMSDSAINAILTQLKQFLSNKDKNALTQVFEERIDQVAFLTNAEKAKEKQRHQTYVSRYIIPTYQKLLSDLDLLKGNRTKEVGLSQLRNGTSYYKALVKMNTGSNRSVKSLISMTKQHLKKMQQDVALIVTKQPKAYEAYRRISWDSYLDASPQKILEMLKNKMKKTYPSGADVSYTVKYVHSSLAKDLSPAFYMVPAIDSYKKNVIYINKQQITSKEQLFSTLAHEGYPGHLYQTTYFHHLTRAPIRYVLNYQGYSEGWATYVESKCFEFLDFGAYDSTIKKLLSYDSLFSLAICSRIDMGVHYEGWNLQQTIDFLADYNINDKKTATTIFHSVIREPGNYLPYYIGYLELIQLKQEYQKAMGKQYKEMNFHKFILDTGPSSFSVLSKYMKKQMNKN